MSETRSKRYKVSNLGFGYAVHDTRAPATYDHPAGRDKEHRSTNVFNSRMLDVFPTRVQAQARADELNEKEGA